MTALPPKSNPVLLIHANAETASAIAPQQLQTIAGRDHEIVQAAGGVDQLQFPLNSAPEFTGNPARRASISLPEQISRRLVSK